MPVVIPKTQSLAEPQNSRNLFCRDSSASKMPFWGPSGGMAAIIDLTSDNIDVPSSEIIDLTSADDPQPSHCASHGPDLKVEDESPTLVGSSTADSGESSPNTRRDDDTALTESNPTDLGDLSPRNSQDEGNSSSDNDLGRIFARKKKRKNVSGDVPISEHKPIDTQLAPEALDPLVGSQPLKAGFDEFWSVRNCHVDDSSSTKTQQDGKQKAHQDKRVTIQQERQSTNNANPQILNIDRDEVLGPDKKKKKHSSKPSTQQESPKRPSRVDEQRPRAPAPRRAVSETPGTAHLKKETGNSGTVKSSQLLEEVETQRPHKRRKHSRRDDTISSSNSQAATLSITRSQVRPTDKPQDRGSETSSVERDCITGKDRATNIHHGGPSRYRPGGARTHREKRTTHIQRRQKKHLARAGEQAQKSERAGSSRQQEEKAFMLASQNGRGQWERSGFQRAGMAFQRPSKGTHDRRATSGRNWGHREARQQPHGVYSGKTGPRLSSESDTAHTEAAVQDEDIGEDQEIPEIRPQQSQQVQGNHDQQESRKIHPKANAAQSAARVEQPEKTMSPAARKKVMEKARQLFENHPSNPALRRKVEVANFIPPDVSKPSFSFRCQMVNASNGKRFGRKSRTATQKDEKRDRDRQRQILARRQKLEAQATQLFPNESEEHRETWIEDGMAQLRQRFTKNDQKREAQKSQGLLTVEDLEDAGAAGSDRIDRPAAAAPKGKRRGIPIAEALEPGATITLYVVYVSDPVDKGEELRNNDMKRLGDQFLRKEDANKHAEVVLRDERYDDSRLVSIQFRVGPEDGLFFGTKELADGRLVMCMVQRERQMASNLDLGDIFGRKELKETYCSRCGQGTRPSREGARGR
ncbi:hypothetical protein F5883DRAFT_683678 [Diaporthe sp. PMI_573]|nr:hypothetical protein F5883DRAFT_683678 [Diaporthaceae sp. PMI_573]